MAVELHRDLRTPDGFTRENSRPVALPETGPEGDQWLRTTLVDGQTGAGSGMPNERADAQFGGFPIGERRYLRWFERVPESLPTTTLDRWQVMGPEIHGPNQAPFDQALMMLEVSPSKRRRLNSNAGRPAARYADIGPIEVGRAYLMELDFILAPDNRGRVLVRRDGGPWVGWDHEPTIFQNTPGSYWKEALYRNAAINGRWVYDVSGMMLYRLALSDDLPGGQAPPPPPPSTGDTTPPRVEMTVSNDGTYLLRFPDRDVVSAISGIAGDPVPVQTHADLEGLGELDGEFDVSRLTPGRTYWAWTIARDAAGNKSPTPGRPFTPEAPPPPPPPPPPDDPCANLREALDAAMDQRNEAAAERDAAKAELLAVKQRVATRTAAFAQGIAEDLED